MNMYICMEKKDGLKKIHFYLDLILNGIKQKRADHPLYSCELLHSFFKHKFLILQICIRMAFCEKAS